MRPLSVSSQRGRQADRAPFSQQRDHVVLRHSEPVVQLLDSTDSGSCRSGEVTHRRLSSARPGGVSRSFAAGLLILGLCGLGLCGVGLCSVARASAADAADGRVIAEVKAATEAFYAALNSAD